ncbi:MAG: tetratricopeptide repeat protein [Pseudobdellovibrionaceae bacterium]
MMLRLLSSLVLSLLMSSIIVIESQANDSAEVSAKMAQVGDAVHLEFSGLDQWAYDLKKVEHKSENIMEMLLPNLSAAAKKDLQNWKNEMIKKVEIDPSGTGGQTSVRFFLADKKVESFDYLTDQPSRLIVDFFRNQSSETPKEPKAEKPVAKQEVKAAEESQLSQKIAIKKTERKPASDLLVPQGKVPGGLNEEAEQPTLETEVRSGVFDGGDPNYDRFSIRDYEIKPDAILRSKKNVYLQFPMLKVENPHLQRLLQNPPIYQIIPKESEENREAQLLLTLFEKKRTAVFIKTAELFLEKYPKTDYKEMILFMKADAYYSLWKENQAPEKFELAMVKYREAMQQFPKSPLAPRSMMLMGFSYLDRGDALNSIRVFQRYISDYPESKMKDAAELALADAYVKLNRFQDALSLLEGISLKAQNPIARTEAYYLKGDVHFQAKEFNKAVESYQQAFEKNPKDWKNFPNAFYNTAESMFWLGQYRKSLDAYRDHLKRFPSHPHAGYAMTRLGELLEILGADQSRVMGTYLETYFRYGENTSATVARMRMLSQRMKNMKPKELEAGIASIREISKKSTLLKMDEFATIMTADGLQKRGENLESIKELERFYQANPTTARFDVIADRIVTNMTEHVRKKVEDGKYLEALRYQSENASGWLKNSKRIDMSYLLGQAFEATGLYEGADVQYSKLLAEIKKIKGTKEDHERRLFEDYPNEDQMNLRLASVNLHENKLSKSYEDFKKIKSTDALTDEEKVERVRIASELMERKGEIEPAKRYLTDLIDQWKGQPEKLISAYARMAEIAAKEKNMGEAEKNWKKVYELGKANPTSTEDLYAKSLKSLGEIAANNGKNDEAANYYNELLTKFEDKRPLHSIRYEVGSIYFKKGELQKAKEIWEPLNSEKTMTWYSLAQEKMKNSEWNKDYKKYIERIPAMENAQDNNRSSR